MLKVTVALLGVLAISHLGQCRRIAEADDADMETQATISNDVNKVKFVFMESVNDADEIDFNNFHSLEGAKLQSDRPTVVTIDGFLSNTTSPMTVILQEGYLQRGDVNLIILDWSLLSGSKAKVGNPFLLAGAYLKVLGNIGPVGRRLGQFLELLEQRKGIPPSNVHLVGGSMGAHIAGAAGSYFRNKYGVPKIGRITGLDPAGPFFTMQVDKNKRLHKGDALFVDIYHSNRGTLGDSDHDTGDINIYLNGGNNQPGCAEVDKETSGVCSHSFAFVAFRYGFEHNIQACPCYGDSACTCNSCSYTCNNPINLGPATHTRSRGRYHASVGRL